MTEITKKITCWTLAGILLLSSISIGAVVLAKNMQQNGASFAADVGGLIVSDQSDGNGIALTKTVIPVEQYADYGVSALSESAITLTATVTPSYASDKRLDWIIDWENPSSAWATGKNVTDHVTVSPTTDGALTAVVSYRQAFGESIIVTARSRSNPSAYATCKFDCRQIYRGTATELLRYDGHPTRNLNFSTSIYGGVITSDLWEYPDNPCVFTTYRYNLVKSDAYTVPLEGNAMIQYYVKPTEDFISRLNMMNTMLDYDLNPSTDWVLLDQTEVNLNEDTVEMAWSVRSDNGWARSFPYYLDKVCGGLNSSQNTFSDQYPGFVEAVNGINNAPAAYSDHICFEIKIVTTFGENTFQTVTQVKFNSLQLSVESVGMNDKSYTF